MHADHVIDPAEFRRVLSAYPTGVCVVSGLVEGKAVGITVGSFTSISLDPPLIGFFIDRASARWPLIAAGGAFSISVLAESQSDACYHFTKHREDEFDGLVMHPGGSTNPVISGAVAWITCEIASTHQLGDHDLIVGSVMSLAKVGDAQPLVFCKGALAGLAKVGTSTSA